MGKALFDRSSALQRRKLPFHYELVVVILSTPSARSGKLRCHATDIPNKKYVDFFDSSRNNNRHKHTLVHI